MDFEVSPELLSIFIEDARGHLEALDHALLNLEREGESESPETVTALLGPLHTLKGNAGMMGFSSVKDYVHRLEDVFARLRDLTLPLTPALFETLFAGASALRDAVELAAQTGTEVRDLNAEIPALLALLKEPAAPGPLPAGPRASPAPAPEAPKAPGPAAAPDQPPRPRARWTASTWPPARASCAWTSRSSTIC